MSTPENKSYLSVGLGGLSPWSSRSSTPKPASKGGQSAEPGIGAAPQQGQGQDHAITRTQRFSPKNYPADCPPLNVRWSYAVDVPKRKPVSVGQTSKDDKPPPAPKKFVSFSALDSRSIETAFQALADEQDIAEVLANQEPDHVKITDGPSNQNDPTKKTSGLESKTTVPVNEDFLFDVDIEKRELGPVYWLGPIYEVRRGTWFYQEGSTLRTCDENLATQLEEGYLKVKPFRYPKVERPPSRTRSRPTSLRAGEEMRPPSSSSQFPSYPPNEAPKDDALQDAPAPAEDGRPLSSPRLQTHRLFGIYMNSVVTYQDSTTAWIVTDDFLSRMSSTVYQRFAGGAHFGGVKVVRGYYEPKKPKETKSDSEIPADGSADKPPERPGTASSEQMDLEQNTVETEAESKRQALERNVSNLVSSTDMGNSEAEEEEARKREEKQMQDDYQEAQGDEQNREIEHLILVTHGIGQRLGLRIESVNFVHDVNVLRKTLKAVYASSGDLQDLNNELEKLPKNCRVQVLPVCWRHLLDFPRQGVRNNRREQDLGDADSFGDEEDYPSLDDITVEGVPAVRNLIADLALDILLYQSAYRQHISGIVLRECNRIHKLFRDRNPTFHGKVSLVGHSLGSAILFDILCHQKGNSNEAVTGRHGRSRSDTTAKPRKDRNPDLDLDFDVDHFFCLGSPIGLFQMLQGRTIAGRRAYDAKSSSRRSDAASMGASALGADQAEDSAEQGHDSVPFTVSSPKCAELFNIFHPTDPISYRIEPLISSAMSSLKPQPLPYTKKGIFNAQMGQGLTGIGARVGQSVSGLWTSLSSGIASSILNRSLGITGEDGKMDIANRGLHDPGAVGRPLSVGAGTNITGGGVIGESVPTDEENKKRKLARQGSDEEQTGPKPPTLLDSEIETLYAGFQKRRKSQRSDDSRDLGESAEWYESEERGRRLRREEAKVRALNSTGRVDFSIQEGVFDISLIASIASHLSYWSDEDVSHFITSQLLSKNRVIKRGGKSSGSGGRVHLELP